MALGSARRAQRGGWQRRRALTAEPAAAQLGPHGLQVPLHVPFSGDGDLAAGFTRARFSPAKTERKETAVFFLTFGKPDCASSCP